MENNASYNVALKILLRKDGKVLFLTLDGSNEPDLPGGRINESEGEVPLEEILHREVVEELGDSIQYKLGKPLLQFRRPADDSGNDVFVTVFDAEYISGEIILSDEHTGYAWVEPKDVELVKKDFTSEEKYNVFAQYFKNEIHHR